MESEFSNVAKFMGFFIPLHTQPRKLTLLKRTSYLLLFYPFFIKLNSHRQTPNPQKLPSQRVPSHVSFYSSACLSTHTHTYIFLITLSPLPFYPNSFIHTSPFSLHIFNIFFNGNFFFPISQSGRLSFS